MILPYAVDAQILAGVALPQETGLLQKLDRCPIAWNAGGFEAVQPQAGKSKWDDRAHRACHVTLAYERQAGPVAKTAGLRDRSEERRVGKEGSSRPTTKNRT